MRKWYFFGSLIIALYIFSKFNTKRAQAKYPTLQRINWTINALVWVLTIAFTIGFFYWLYTVVFQ